MYFSSHQSELNKTRAKPLFDLWPQTQFFCFSDRIRMSYWIVMNIIWSSYPSKLGGTSKLAVKFGNNMILYSYLDLIDFTELIDLPLCSSAFAVDRSVFHFHFHTREIQRNPECQQFVICDKQKQVIIKKKNEKVKKHKTKRNRASQIDPHQLANVW